MDFRTLPKTDIEVSMVCMGCWAIGGGSMWGDQDESDAMAAIRTCLDLGVNFFDTAEGYAGGASEELLARGLAGRRDEAVIATKVSPDNIAREEDLRSACEHSLKRLETDVIDLYQIHWPNHDAPMEVAFGALDRLKAEGKIRAYGVSNFGPQDLTEALGLAAVASNQVSYNLLWRGVEVELAPLCVEKDVGILCYSPIMQGMLTGKYATPEDVPEQRARCRLFSSERKMARHGESGCEEEVFAALGKIREISEGLGLSMAEVALAWLVAQPAVTSAISGCRSAEQARVNANAGELKLSQDTLDALSECTRPIKEKMGSAMDLWAEEGRIR